MGNVSKLVAAAALVVVVAGIAICGLYFSSISQVVMSCLQSDVEQRNTKIAALEAREQELQKSISSHESDVRSLGWMKLQLKEDIDRVDPLRSQIALLEEQKQQVDVPALKYPSENDPDFRRKRHEVFQKENVLKDGFSEAQADLQHCLHSVVRHQ